VRRTTSNFIAVYTPNSLGVCRAQQLLKSASAAGVPYHVAVRRVIIPSLGGYRLVVVSKIMDCEFDCAATIQSARESLQHYTQQAMLFVLFLQRLTWALSRTEYFDARYVRDPQSSGTEVLGTANIDLWHAKLSSVECLICWGWQTRRSILAGTETCLVSNHDTHWLSIKVVSRWQSVRRRWTKRIAGREVKRNFKVMSTQARPWGISLSPVAMFSHHVRTSRSVKLQALRPP